MKKNLLFLLLIAVSPLLKAQSVCNAAGDLMVFTNYDGGTLTINVDQNIPNLKIGVCTYEAVKIVLTGAFVNNVIAVRYAGYNGNNNNCGPGVPTTTIMGAPVSAATTTVFAPPATITNTNGYGSIICGYSCNNNTSQGGCNTVDQVEAYFLNYFSGSTLYAHKVQYGCWTGTSSVSAGGNCCPAVALNPGSVAASQTICAGDTPAALTSVASASNVTGTITYSWQASTTSTSSGFANITGANTGTYAPGSLSQTTYYRRAAATTATNAAYSNVITITVLTPPAVSIAGTSSVCEGVTTTLTATGGTAFTWLPGSASGSVLVVTPTVTTDYTVIALSAGGCSNTTTKQIVVSPLPVVTVASSSTEVCDGHFVTLSAQGGVAYSWNGTPAITSNTILVLPVTTTDYSVTATDANGCQNTAIITVTVHAIPAVTITPASATLCSGQSLTLTASGAVNYTWFPGGIVGSVFVTTPSASGIYSVTGADSNCQVSDSYTLTVNPSPTVTISSSNSSVCPGQPAVLTASGAMGYILLNTTLALPGNSVSVSPTITTTYSISGTAANNCTNVGLKTVTVDVCNGVNAVTKAVSELKVFPNPSKGEFMMASDADGSFEIINSLGEVVRVVTLDSKNDRQIVISGLQSGVYIVSSLTNKTAPLRKIIVTR